MVSFIKVVQVGDRYTFEDLMINPDNVSIVEESHTMNTLLREDISRFPDGLQTATRFSTLIVDGKTYTVVGSLYDINQKLQSRRLLKG